jgi:NADPH-dependent 2,4-dienoyl-CoA reductase/sulfur reductase-like enzyme
MKHYDLLVIGGVAAGMSAASQARRADKEIAIGVFEKSDYVSYGACGMPYYISDLIGDHRRLIAIDKDDYIAKRQIDIFTGAEALGVNFKENSVTIRAGEDEELYSYKNLVIATGAKPVVPPIDGIESGNVFVLRNLNDGIAIKEFIQRYYPKSGVLIGGGFIGLEMAESFRELGIESVIIEKMESVAMTMDKEIRERITEKLRENDVTILTGIDINRVSRNGNKLLIHYDDNVLETDLIIVSIGVLPNTDFLRGTELDMNERGAIIVDEKSQTNLKGVYAAGDCATVKHLITGRDVYMPLGSTANKQGRVAGLQAAGIETEIFKGIVGSQLVKVFDLEVGKTGFSEREAEMNGIRAESSVVTWKDIAGYCPASENIFVKITINSDTREIIGGQLAGKHGAAQRTNIIATAISARMKIDDFAYLDLGYAPPFAPVWDSLLVAAQKLVKR